MRAVRTKEADLTEGQTDTSPRWGGLAGILGSLLEVGGVHGGDEGAQGLVDEPGQHEGADLWSLPPRTRPEDSPPTITSVPVEVRALRRRDSDELPPMSRITSYAALVAAKSSRV